MTAGRRTGDDRTVPVGAGLRPFPASCRNASLQSCPTHWVVWGGNPWPPCRIQRTSSESAALLRGSGVQIPPARDVLEVLVTAFRELRSGLTDRGDSMERLSSVMSTAEAVSVAH